jgi:DNA polymerase
VLVNPEDYDPRAYGADCDRCPLKGHTVVPPEWSYTDLERLSPESMSKYIAIVGEAPGEQEEKQGRPFIGPSGAELDRALRMAGIQRKNTLVTNVLLCRPPGNKLDLFLTSINKRNQEAAKSAKEKGEKPPEPIPSPIECCRPRLQGELVGHRNVITLGKVAMRAVTGSEVSIMAVRGAVMTFPETEETEERLVMPTIHPAFVLRQQRWSHVFRNDIGKAARWFKGQVDWEPPAITYQPSPDQLREFLKKPEILAFDLETDGIEPLTARIRCVGVGTGTEVYICGFLSKDGVSHFYAPDVEQEVKAVLIEWLADQRRFKTSWNGGSYDRTVLEQQWGVTVRSNIDGILIHRNVESELPHGLAYAASMYTTAPAWKCYDGETEVLTRHRGWVRLDSLESDVEVAQWDHGAVSFVKPKGWVNQEYTGSMWSFTGQAVDLLVTPNHKMVYLTREGVKLVREGGPVGVVRTTTAEMLPVTGSMPHTGVLTGGEEWDPNLVKLIVAFQADGTWAWRKDKDEVPAYLDFGFTKERKIERLKQILSSLGMGYTEKKTGVKNPRTRIWVKPHPNVSLLWMLLGPRKEFGAWVLSLSVLSRLVFLDEVPLWDGTWGKEHRNYSTTSKTNADWVQVCAVASGRAARVALYDGVWCVVLPEGRQRDKTWSKLDSLRREKVDYSGRVYCLSVDSGFLLVRRRGKVSVSGNSDRDGNKLSTYAESDQALHQYCALDVGITHRILPPLVDQLKLRGGESILAIDQGMQAVCVDMHTVGMYVDQEKRLEEEKRLLKRRFELLHTLRDRLYDTNTLGKKAAEAFNPGSVQQLSDILFTRWNIIPPLDEKEALTSNGDPSTADVVLRAVLMDQTVPKERRDIIKLLRYYRKVQKILGTYVLKLRLRTMTVEDDLGWDEEEDWVDRETRKRYGMERTGIVDPVTGRMYPGWSASVAVTGRLSSSKPINAQNFPVSCRSMVMAAPGNVLVGADADQLEVRVASALWGIERYLQAFREGKDPHSMTAFMIFGDAFCKAAGIDPACFDRPGILEGKCYKDGQFVGKGEAKDLRSLGKGVHFACVDKDEPVIVLGPEGQKPISELQVGDWTWTWATARKRYEPSRITAVVPKGQKACVRVHFSWWGGPRKGRCTGSMVVTDDHRCLLRDGTYRAAGSLRPGDRLMPFRRRTKMSAEGREYRWVFPYNNQEERAEHRCVAGYYDNDRTNIHHESGITLNNNPANLTAMSPAEHTLEHASNLTASRLGSQKWRDSVRQPKVNLDPEKKAAAVAKRAETMKQNNTYPKSRLDPWADRMGHVSDQVIAAEANVTHQAVYYYRKTRGIPAYWKEEKGGTNHEVTHIESVGMREVWDIEVDHEDHNFPLASGVFVHNSQYMAGDERVQKMIASTEVPAKGPDGKPADDGTTDLPYALLPLSKVRQMREKWLKGVPEYAIGWQREIEEWRDQGFLKEPVTLRRRDFLDGEAPNELVNFKVQGGAAGLMNLAMLELHAQIPRHKWGPGTGIIGQVHDWIGIECPESEAEKVKSILEGVMNRTHPSLSGMKFTATAVAGKRWSEV